MLAGIAGREFMGTREHIEETLKKNLPFICEQFNVRSIGIFGSYARDSQHEKSDVDILVEFEKGYKDLFNYIRLKTYLEHLFNAEVDLVMKEAIKPKLKEIILREVRYV